MGRANVNPDRAILAQSAVDKPLIPLETGDFHVQAQKPSCGNSTIASPVATFSSCWLRTSTSISTHRDFAVDCFDLITPAGRIVSPGFTGFSQRVSRRRWIAPAG